MPNFARYNAKDASVVIGGVHITSLGEDMISIEKEEVLAENIVGAHGDIVRSEINNSISDSVNDIYESDSNITHFYLEKILIDYDSPHKDMLIEKFEKKEPVELKSKNKEINQYSIIKDVVNCKEGIWFILAPHT